MDYQYQHSQVEKRYGVGLGSADQQKRRVQQYYDPNWTPASRVENPVKAKYNFPALGECLNKPKAASGITRWYNLKKRPSEDKEIIFSSMNKRSKIDGFNFLVHNVPNIDIIMQDRDMEIR